jgi:translation initiation factor 2-alpha kinase 4
MLHQDTFFKDGIYFEIVRRKRRSDIIASGGRYDGLISSMTSPQNASSAAVCAMGVEIAIDKITAALAAYQGTIVKALVKEQRSFGFWSPRRCDVYVVSYQPGHLHDRLEVAAMLWHHGISTDIMYESGLPDADQENHLDVCLREGILFTVYPRPRTGRRDQPAFKVKSVLKGTEYEVSRQELVAWLQQQISEQKRVDAATSGVSNIADNAPSNLPKEVSSSSALHVILPTDTKKQRKQTKQIFYDRTFDMAAQVKSIAQSGMQVLAIDVPGSLFDVLTRNSSWITDDEAWRPILPHFPTGQSAYANQIREDAQRRKSEGHRLLLLFSVREERVGLLMI